ncbi:MAG: putative oxidoreductase YdhV [Anaerolineales bacterium]|nr:putative oxidoreductase YdhV [Anaerolineales bacterium]
MAQICRVDVDSGEIKYEAVPETWERLGGRALGARILLDEVPPLCDPLGRHNKLIFAPGTVVGHMVSSCDRISVCGKSPLTGGVKEANAGGTTGLKLVWLGLHALIIEGRPGDPETSSVLYLSQDEARLEPADDLAGLGIYASAERLLDRFGDDVGIAMIGPAGEMQMTAAGVVHLDKDRVPGRISARGGLGALMGSKGLKAIVIDDAGASMPPLVDKELFNDARKRYIKAIQEHPQTSEIYTDYGTAAMVAMCNAKSGIPTRNFSAGRFEHAEEISGEMLHDLIAQRGGEGEHAHACMPGCTIRCSNVFADGDGETIVSPIEYETIGLLGSNLGIDSLDTIGELNVVINDLGLDTIEIGAVLGVVAEAGFMEWGDGERAAELLEEIRQDTMLGRALGGGAGLAGKVLGVERVPVAKNQAISAYDPRAIKGTGVTYATSPQGADHTCGLTIRSDVDQTQPEGQADVSKDAQIKMAGYDSLGICLMGGFAFGQDLTMVRDMVNGRYGWGVGDDYLLEVGRQALRLEREFNRRAGFTTADDRLPEWMTEEPLPPLDTVFDVPAEDLDTIFDDV